MTRTERHLKLLMQAVGTAAMLAIPCAMMPYWWMDAVHQWLGMGTLPEVPIVGYLARSTSLFYGLLGGLFWTVSFDMRRHRPVIRYLGAALTLFGLALLAADLAEGMPWWWCLVEGPINVLLGMAILLLAWRIDESR